MLLRKCDVKDCGSTVEVAEPSRFGPPEDPAPPSGWTALVREVEVRLPQQADIHPGMRRPRNAPFPPVAGAPASYKITWRYFVCDKHEIKLDLVTPPYPGTEVAVGYVVS